MANPGRTTIERWRMQRALALLSVLLLGSAALATPNGTISWQGQDKGSGGALTSTARALFAQPAVGGLLSARPEGPFIGGPARRRQSADTPPAQLSARIEALVRRPPTDFSGLGALGCIAVSIYHEARNQPPEGQYAVGSVILTRAADPTRWGDTACAVVQPIQFSYLTPDRHFAPIHDPGAWAQAVQIAARVLRDGPAPDLRGADHYHATYVWPDWNRHMEAVGRIADHVFWRSAAPRR